MRISTCSTRIPAYADKISKLDVGNERIIAVELDFGTKLCPINIYMPTNKTDPEYKYRECAWMCCTISLVDMSFYTKSCYLEI